MCQKFNGWVDEIWGMGVQKVWQVAWECVNVVAGTLDYTVENLSTNK